MYLRRQSHGLDLSRAPSSASRWWPEEVRAQFFLEVSIARLTANRG